MNKLAYYLIKLIKEMVGLPFYWLAFLFPRSKHIWVFGEWHGLRYADNSKYLFEYINKHNSEICAVWLCKEKSLVKDIRSKGYKAYLNSSFYGMLFALRARVHLVTHDANDTLSYLSGGSVLVYLTHGTPVKRLGKDAQFARMGQLTPLIDRYSQCIFPSKRAFDFVFCADRIAAQRFTSAFPSSGQVLPFGYPRWDAFFKQKTNPYLDDITARYSLVISYMPTLRFNNQKRYDPFSVPGFNDFIDFLRKNNYLLIIRPHPVMTFANNSVHSDNIKFLRSDAVSDVFDIFNKTDILITDYSSVMFDYKKLNRKIMLLTPDLNSYLNQDVGVYGDFLNDAVGDVVMDWNGLIDNLKPYSTNERHALDFFEGGASERITSYLKEHIGLCE